MKSSFMRVFHHCYRLPDYATRACLMTTETFKSRGMFADAAFEFIKLTNEVSITLLSSSF